MADHGKPPLLTQTVPQHFREVVKSYGDRNACVNLLHSVGVEDRRKY